jgi:large subunit ribosomal protein L25
LDFEVYLGFGICYLLFNKIMDIKATKRTILGSQVKKLRRMGVLPASVYGKKVKSENIQIDEKAFLKVYSEAGDTKLIDLKIEDGASYPVLIHLIHKHPINDNILNVDFLAVDLKEAIKVAVPVLAIGVPQAVIDKLGALLQPQQELEIECLPTDLPEKIEVDVSKLAQLGDTLLVSDIKFSDKIKVLSDLNLTVFTISELVQKEKIEEEVTPHEAEATAQKKVEEGEEGQGEDQKDEKVSPAKEEKK